ncbi:NADH-ubiquinone reductase complex 1 MLRQ subunit-domain-containing protein [Gongronella butleri]|nr:NADH-ubiquinone reductase complex 1 MLRQ subunit-domain-containing protein [Gongronella butleri]
MGAVLHFIRQAKNKPEIYPLVGILSCAVVGAVFMSAHQSRAPDVVWNHKTNAYPWNDVEGNKQVKLWAGNQKYDGRYHRTQL